MNMPIGISKAAMGVVLIAACGIIGTGEVILAKILMEQGWPYFYLSAGNLLIVAIATAIGSKVLQDKLPKRRAAVWVFLRSLFSNAIIVLAVLAVKVGAGPGDVAALTSINVVVAALLGHAFLKEKLRPIQLAALPLSLAGAVLIAKPSFLFGQALAEGSWIGNLLAAVAGIAQAVTFVCARKSANESGCLTSCVESMLGIVIFPLLPLIAPLPASWEPLADNVPLAAAYMAALLFSTGSGVITGALGSQMCPAAVGSTVLTVSATVTGYFAQAVFFSTPLSVLSIVGAILLLSSVAIMTATRVQPSNDSDPAPAESAAPAAEDSQTSNADESTNCCDLVAGESESIANFAAVEFVEVAAHEQSRRRRTAAGPSVETIGALAMMASA
eukprot:TRINITY_DN96005_c0_g1_i1.p1 TRINITY_DN96005_c0_g1~~TRINITY_DN96005_c0_g1_i1.p1  ORF type:complete len:387 (+),score=84.97 TRINITY_DN96005_c0_g1_i1:73-1233(+)